MDDRLLCGTADGGVYVIPCDAVLAGDAARDESEGEKESDEEAEVGDGKKKDEKDKDEERTARTHDPGSERRRLRGGLRRVAAGVRRRRASHGGRRHRRRGGQVLGGSLLFLAPVGEGRVRARGVCGVGGRRRPRRDVSAHRGIRSVGGEYVDTGGQGLLDAHAASRRRSQTCRARVGSVRRRQKGRCRGSGRLLVRRRRSRAVEGGGGGGGGSPGRTGADASGAPRGERRRRRVRVAGVVPATARRGRSARPPGALRPRDRRAGPRGGSPRPAGYGVGSCHHEVRVRPQRRRRPPRQAHRHRAARAGRRDKPKQ